MPKPKPKETQKEFISRCIPIVMHEGTTDDEKQAAAICYKYWRESKSTKLSALEIKVIDEFTRKWSESGLFQNK